MYARLPLGIACLLAAALAPANSAAGQDTTSTAAGGVAAGISVERFVVPGGDGALTMLAVHTDALRPRGVGLDFALAVPPALVTEGCMIGVADLGPSASVQDREGAFVLRGGVTAIGIGCEEGVAIVPGAYVGLSRIFRTGSRVGLRADISPHVFVADNEWVTTLTFGIGITSLPRMAPER